MARSSSTPRCTKLAYANVQLMPDPTIASNETGTRHRTAERVARQTEALVISISQQRETVTVFVGQSRYQLEPIADVLAKTNQALSTLETYRARLEQVLTRLTALEFQNAVMLDDVLVVLQRAELTTRMAEEVERACVELGEEGRLIRMQLDELVADVPDEKAALVYDYHAEGGAARTQEGLEALAGLPYNQLLEFELLAVIGYPASVNPLDHAGLAARLPRPLAHPAAPRRGGQARGREPGRAGRDRASLAARTGGGRGCRLGSRPRDQGGPAPAPGAQSRRPLPPNLALSRDFPEKGAVSSDFC